MEKTELEWPASLFLFGARPVVDGTLSDCVTHWRDNLSLMGQALSRIRVYAPGGEYWISPEDVREHLTPETAGIQPN
jgi:hypothetical protein